jgi:uncharacterized phage-associated protein
MTPEYAPKMNPKLEAVLSRLCERLGPLTKTRAVKLPYLVDVVARHVLGHAIARGRYQTWDHGVVTREIYAFMTHTDGNDQLTVEDHDFSESGRQVRLRSKPSSGLILDEEERQVVDFVADEYGELDAGRLGLLTKAMNSHLEADVWGSNQQPATGEDAYARLTESWYEFFERLPSLDLGDPSQLETIDDPRRHLRALLDA